MDKVKLAENLTTLTKVGSFTAFNELDHKIAGVEPIQFIAEEEADFDVLYESLGLAK